LCFSDSLELPSLKKINIQFPNSVRTDTQSSGAYYTSFIEVVFGKKLIILYKKLMSHKDSNIAEIGHSA